MATLLTKDYTKIATIVLQDSTYDNKIYLYGKAKEPDSENNKTKALFKMTYYRSAGYITVGSGKAELDGETKSYSNTTFNAGETTIFNDIEREITHNADGTTETLVIPFSWEGSLGGSGSEEVEVKVQNIPLISISDLKKDQAKSQVTTFDTQGLEVIGGGWDITTDSTKTTHTYIEGTPLEKAFTDLTPNTTYYIRTWIETSAGGVNSKWTSFTTKKNNVVRLRVSDNWKESIPYIRVNGAWKEATPYINVNGTYKEIN